MHENGDKVGKGEVDFRWHVGDSFPFLHTGSRPRAKFDDGESFYFKNSEQYLIPNVAETTILPNFAIFGDDRDFLGFASANPAALDYWHWNGFLNAQTVADVDNFATCGSFDEIDADHAFADSRCVKLDSIHGQSDAVRFATILAIHRTPAADHVQPPG